MATPINSSNNVDLGGNVLCVKYIKTGYNNAGSISGSGATVLANAPGNIVGSGTTLTMTADTHLGTTVSINTVASTITLPAATGTGNVYNIMIATTTTSSHVVQAAGSDKIYGVASVGGTTGGVFVVNNNTTFTMSATTTGGKQGGYFNFIDSGLNFWIVEANLVGSGTAATPISA